MTSQPSRSRHNTSSIRSNNRIAISTPTSRIYTRVLDGLPGCVAWIAIVSAILGAVFFPTIILFVAVGFASYSAVRFFVAGYASIIGNRRIKQWDSVDWYQRYQEETKATLLDWSAVYHVVIIPNYNESLDLLCQTLTQLANCELASEQLIVVLAMEQAEEGYQEKATHLTDTFGSHFAEIIVTAHPSGLPDEFQCKSANQAWAFSRIKHHLVDSGKHNADHLIITSMDADTQWHPRYFSAISYFFATDEARHACFWQAPIRYHSNVWRVHPLLRLVNAYSSAFELAYLTASWWRSMPISSYSLSYKLLEQSGSWDADVISDEWHMYIKAFFVNNANVTIKPVYLPFNAYATNGHTVWRMIRNRYLQTLRHAWGSKEIGYIVDNMRRYHDVSLTRGLSLLFRVSHDLLLAGAGWAIVSLGSLLPILFHEDVRLIFFSDRWSHPLFILFQVIIMLMIILGIAVWWEDVRQRPPRKKQSTLSERVWVVLGFALLPILTMIFVALPVLHAQTRLMFGLTLPFRVTEKL